MSFYFFDIIVRVLNICGSEAARRSREKKKANIKRKEGATNRKREIKRKI